MSRILGVAIAAMTIVGGPKSATAARLWYEMHPGDLACPSQIRFAEEVSAKLGFSPWTGDGLMVHVSIDLSTGRYTGHLVHDRDHEREFNADTCRRVADLLVTATAIALDRSEPVRATSSESRGGARTSRQRVRVATADSPPPRAGELVLPADPATEWAFAPRNNNFQLGAGIDSLSGALMVSGAVPLFRGHLDVGLGRQSTSYASSSMSVTVASALYMWPVFYLNKNSSFEVPIFAGGGLGAFWTSQNGGGTASMTTTDSKIMPELAISQGLQFRKLPVEFLLAMTFALGDPPRGTSFGVDVAFRYVFRGH